MKRSLRKLTELAPITLPGIIVEKKERERERERERKRKGGKKEERNEKGKKKVVISRSLPSPTRRGMLQ